MSADLLAETVERLFAERASPLAQRASTEGPEAELWPALAELRLPWVSVPEAAGGAGGDLEDAFTILFHAGRHAVALPLAETGILGGWLLAAAGLPLPEGPLAVPVRKELAVPVRKEAVPVVPDGEGLELRPRGSGWEATGRLVRVPWGAGAAGVVALARAPDGLRVVLILPEEVEVTRGRNLAGEPRDTLVVDAVALGPERVGPPPPYAFEWLQLRGAVARTLLVAGALEAASQLTVAYAGERIQFGRQIASFQAVAQRLAQMAAAAEAAGLAAQVAAGMLARATRLGSGPPGSDVGFAVAAAKVTAGRSAREVSAHAHQVHGAVGMTEEYELHHFTRRLWCWSYEWGTEAAWAGWLGDRLSEEGAPGLWPALTTGLRHTTGTPNPPL